VAPLRAKICAGYWRPESGGKENLSKEAQGEGGKNQKEQGGDGKRKLKISREK